MMEISRKCIDKMSNDKQLQIRLSSSHKRRLEELCHGEKVSVSEKVRELIEGYLNLSQTSPQTKKGQPFIPSWNPSETKRSFTVGEMYSGPGGIGLALSNSKHATRGYALSFEHAWATDYDPDTCRTYKNNLLSQSPSALSICSDVKDLDIDSLPIVDGFLYGFPCNDFSLVGESLGIDGKFGGLYKFGVDFINRSNPLFIFAENVSGISSSNSGNTFQRIVRP